MAVFLVNICKFKGCGVVFPTLNELIHHIEDSHLDFNSETVEKDQFPACLPISYILRVFSGEHLSTASSPITPTANATNTLLSTNETAHQRKEMMVMATAAMKANNQIRNKLSRTQSPAPSFSSTTPTGSEMEEDTCESESEESSIDSWSTRVPDTNLIRNTTRNFLNTNSTSSQEEQEKPYACHIDGCRKRYRNPNGLKYHSKSAHSCIPQKEINNTRLYKCHCGKVYKTAHGLRNHELSQHSALIITEVEKASANNTSNSNNNHSINGSNNSINENTQITKITVNNNNSNNNSNYQQSKTQSLSDENKTKESKLQTDVCPIIRAPTLQQHLLSPLVAKVTSKC